jgi:Zn-dependent protease with chaperone function
VSTSELASQCPSCATELPVVPGYPTWCHECGWNLTTRERTAAPRRLGRLYDELGRRLGERLATSFTVEAALAPRLTPARVAAYVIASLTLALSLAFAAGSAALFLLALPNIAAIVCGVVLALLAVLVRPRLGRLPQEGVLPPDEAPTLYALTGEVAEALGTRPVDVVVVDARFNASWGVVGIGRKRVLTLGLSLLACLAPQERVAVMSHELAHSRNGDAGRTFFVGSAVRSLQQLYLALRPHRDEPELGFADVLGNALLWVVSRPFYALYSIEAHLLLRDSQRAEYLADALAARVAGTEAVLGLHEKLLLEPIVEVTIQRAAFEREHGETPNVFERLGRSVLEAPPRERERRRRVAQLENTRLDATHPPTSRRIHVLEARPRVSEAVTLGDERSAAIDRELAPHRERLAGRLLDEFRDSLYA